MREREEEIKNIHKGMHTVNEIYKVRWTGALYSLLDTILSLTTFCFIVQDLAGLVDEQQEGVDTIEAQMENTKENTATGLKHIEKANESANSQCAIS